MNTHTHTHTHTHICKAEKAEIKKLILTFLLKISTFLHFLMADGSQVSSITFVRLYLHTHNTRVLLFYFSDSFRSKYYFP